MGRTREAKTVDAPLAPVGLHDRSAGGDPPVDEGEKEETNAGADHGPDAARDPSVEPQDVAGGEVEPHEHVARREVHGAVHAHVHAIAVGSGPGKEGTKEGGEHKESEVAGMHDLRLGCTDDGVKRDARSEDDKPVLHPLRNTAKHS